MASVATIYPSLSLLCDSDEDIDGQMDYSFVFPESKTSLQSLKRKERLLEDFSKERLVIRQPLSKRRNIEGVQNPSLLSTINKPKNYFKLPFRRPRILSLKVVFKEWADKEKKSRSLKKKRTYICQRWKAHTVNAPHIVLSNGLEKFNSAIHALNRLDDLGYNRSKHQIEFHSAFLAAMAPQIFAGDLHKYLEDLLEALGLKQLCKDVAVCCPRRFGKTTSVALYISAISYTQGDMDMVTYSIAMRTSRMLAARVYQMILALANGANVFRINNQEILEVKSIGGGYCTNYFYPAASTISILFMFFLLLYIYIYMCVCVHCQSHTR